MQMAITVYDKCGLHWNHPMIIPHQFNLCPRCESHKCYRSIYMTYRSPGPGTLGDLQNCHQYAVQFTSPVKCNSDCIRDIRHLFPKDCTVCQTSRNCPKHGSGSNGWSTCYDQTFWLSRF